jgi:hypothetical protein
MIQTGEYGIFGPEFRTDRVALCSVAPK